MSVELEATSSSHVQIVRLNGLSSSIGQSVDLSGLMDKPLKLNLKGKAGCMCSHSSYLFVCMESGDVFFYDFGAQSEKHLAKFHSSVSSK